MVLFSARGFRPRSFLWRRRSYPVEGVNLAHRVREGADWCYYFAVTSGGGSYRLSFSTRNMAWRLLESYIDG
ncbi:MAG: hypothetical protein RDV48_09525 [Candidatus Eremiobacteraeota bacterium]|nr:hypothetical protein [Candidatus Eremiobacteraeota bacterium]